MLKYNKILNISFTRLQTFIILNGKDKLNEITAVMESRANNCLNHYYMEQW